jgi:hypothetical protein
MRVGRCHKLPAPAMLAFAMATHERLGTDCVLFLRKLPPELIKRVFEAALTCNITWPGGAAGKYKGVLRLLGALASFP